MTAEQVIRRVLIDNLPRDLLINAIARHICRVAISRRNQYGYNNPKHWYSAKVHPMRKKR